jgi:hypothetical protein
MRTKFLTGDVNWQVYGGKFVTKKLNNGEFDYWLVVDVINMHQATGDLNQSKYSVSIQAVSPGQAGKEKIQAALDYCGIDLNTIHKKHHEAILVEALSDYGVYANLRTFSGNNLSKLMKEARKELQVISCLFGFYMDCPENRIGDTGWDMIQGNLCSHLRG